MALIDPETVLKLAPPSWRPTMAAMSVAIALTITVVFSVYLPLSAASAGVLANKASIDAQSKVNDQINRRLGNLEKGQSGTQQQLQDLQGTEDRNAQNQDIILQFLLTGQRPKPH